MTIIALSSASQKFDTLRIFALDVAITMIFQMMLASRTGYYLKIKKKKEQFSLWQILCLIMRYS